MHPRELEALPDATWAVPPPDPVPVVRAAYASDLLSDVVAHAPEDSILVTVQAHTNTVAVASLVGIRVLVICHQRPIPADLVAAARRERVGVLTTSLNQLQASHRVCQLLEAHSC